MSNEPSPNSEIILYQTEYGRTRVQCRFEHETVWLTQALLAELFDIGVNTVNYHLKAIFAEGELRPEATIRYYRIVRTEGSRQISRQCVAREVVGYRVMNRDMVSRFGGDSVGRGGIATEIPTKCRDFALSAIGVAESRQFSRHHGRCGRKKDHRMGRPFRAWNRVGDGTQGAALGCRMMPRWGGRMGQIWPSGEQRRKKS